MSSTKEEMRGAVSSAPCYDKIHDTRIKTVLQHQSFDATERTAKRVQYTAQPIPGNLTWNRELNCEFKSEFTDLF